MVETAFRGILGEKTIPQSLRKKVANGRGAEPRGKKKRLYFQKNCRAHVPKRTGALRNNKNVWKRENRAQARDTEKKGANGGEHSSFLRISNSSGGLRECALKRDKWTEKKSCATETRAMNGKSEGNIFAREIAAGRRGGTGPPVCACNRTPVSAWEKD